MKDRLLGILCIAILPIVSMYIIVLYVIEKCSRYQIELDLGDQE